MAQKRYQGTVKFYNAAQKYGFITPNGGTKDLFVHAETLEKSGIDNLKTGDVVNYSIYKSKKAKSKKHNKGKIAAKNLELTGW